jgi:hypothetical protein
MAWPYKGKNLIPFTMAKVPGKCYFYTGITCWHSVQAVKTHAYACQWSTNPVNPD